jgi:hypothetical protein
LVGQGMGPFVGAVVGSDVEASVGANVGVVVGARDGDEVGRAVGPNDGDSVGPMVGAGTGAFVGLGVRAFVGVIVGADVGAKVEDVVGADDPAGLTEGIAFVATGPAVVLAVGERLGLWLHMTSGLQGNANSKAQVLGISLMQALWTSSSPIVELKLACSM